MDDDSDDGQQVNTNQTLLQFTQLLQTPSDYSYQDSFHEENNAKNLKTNQSKYGGSSNKKNPNKGQFGKTQVPKFEPQQFVKRDLFKS